jgi:hypothetical protein
VTLRNADNANPAIVNARRSCVPGVVADRTGGPRRATVLDRACAVIESPT